MNTSTKQLIIIAVVGIVAGWLASIVVGGPSGLLGYLVTGLIGAFVGNVVLAAIGWKPNLGSEIVDAIVSSAIGAVIVVILAKLIIFG